jgi:hypothetical protein
VYPAPVTTPAFIEIGEDDLPVAQLPTDAAMPVASPQRRRRRTTTAQGRAVRQYTNDRKAFERGEAITVADPHTAPDVIADPINADTDDLAAVVVRRTMKEMATGRLKPTLRDGLTAQQLLDRRAEKAADRSFMLNLAMALAGGGKRVPVKYLPAPNEPDPDIIEGDFTEENLAPDHLRQA